MTALTLRLPRIEKPLLYSVVVHVAFMLGVAGVQYVKDRRNQTKLEYIELEMAAPMAASNSSVISVKGKGAGAARQSQFAGLLSQAMKGVGAAKVSAVAKGGEKMNIAQMANGLKQGLLDSTKGAKTTNLRAGAVQGASQVAWDRIQTSSGTRSQPLSNIDREAIRKAIASHEEAFRSCHERALLADMSMAGQADLTFHVGTGGGVSTAQLAYSGKGEAAGKSILRECLVAESKRVRFPVNVAGHQVKFSLILR